MRPEKLRLLHDSGPSGQQGETTHSGLCLKASPWLVSNLKGNHLLDQIKVFKDAGAPNLQGPIPKYADEKRQALVDAVELYKEGVWVTDRAEDWKSDGEDFDFEGVDNDTSDTDSD